MSLENQDIKPINKVERVTIDDLRPERFENGETEIILQRNAKDNRDPNSPIEMGALLPEAAEKVRQHAKKFFEDMFSMLGEDAKITDILVVAADTKLETPIDGVKSHHQRAVETAEEVIVGLKEAMEAFSLEQKQLLNKSGKPIQLTSGRLRDLRIFEDSPEFVNFLKEKYGQLKEFWVAYEVDKEKEIRIKMGAEGPEDVADRIDSYLRVLANAAKAYEESHPGRKLIVWAVSHYDTISPYIKKHISQLDETSFHDDYLPVEQGAGIVMVADKQGNAETKIQGQKYQVSLGKRL